MSISDLGVLTLDASNDARAQWIFQMTGDLSVGSEASVALTNGALASNVYWIVGSSASLGYGSIVSGDIIAISSILVALNAVLDGRLLSLVDVMLEGASTLGLPAGSSATAPRGSLELGACGEFSILAGSTISFSPVLTVVTRGSVGSSSGGIISGNYLVDVGTTQSGTAASIQAMNDYVIVNSEAAGKACSSSLESSDLSGLTLAPGVYCSVSGMLSLGAWSSVTLDAEGVTSSVWILQSTSTLVTGDHSSVVLVNGALGANVYWSVGSTATLGASSFFVGDIFAMKDIVVGSESVVKGHSFTMESVTFLGGCLLSQTANIGKSDLSLLSALKVFVALAGGTIAFGTDETVISSGSLGVSPGTDISGNYLLTDGTAEMASPSSTAAALALAIMYNAGSTLRCEYPLESGDLSGLSLGPGVYCALSGGRLSISDLGVLTLDASNNTKAQWIFQSPTSLSTGAGSDLKLKNGAQASNVYWIVDSVTTLGYASNFHGNILSISSIQLSPYAAVTGRVFSFGKIVADGFSTAALPAETVLTGLTLFNPSTRKGSVCVISSINSRFDQVLWSGTDASKSMAEAIAVSMGIPVETVVCGIASQLCLTSPTSAPTSSPSVRPKTRLSIHGEGSSFSLAAATGVVRTKELSFSITKDVPG